MNLQVSREDFYSFIKGIVMSFASLAEDRQINFAVMPTESDELVQGLAEAYFDRDKVEKVLTNLLSNAFKFTPAGGEVTFSIAVQPDAVEMSVQNTGSTIPSRVIEAEDGHTGMELAIDTIPDLVISDVMMPERRQLHRKGLA